MSQFRGNTGTLIIVVRRAKDLPNKRKMEKQNPYCLLRISNLTDKTKACFRGGQTPNWDEELRFNMTPEIQPVLKLSVLDETKKAPVFVSETEIDFTPVFYSSVKEGYDKWYTLTSNGRDSGEIYLEMTFYPSRSNSSSFGSSGGSNEHRKVFSSSQNSTARRNLPPIPGLSSDVQVKPEEDLYGIPPPIERNTGRDSSEIFRHSSPSSSPKKQVDPFSMSIHSLPDVPMHKTATPFSPVRDYSELPAKSYFNQPQSPPSKPSSHQLPSPYHSVSKDIDEAQSLTSLQQPVSPKLKTASPTSDLKALTKKLASSISIFGSRDTSPTKQTSNPFDELEREVQSDWTKNNPGELPAPSSFKKHHQQEAPPPVPSHGSFNLSTGSSTSLPPPPIPQHSLNSNSSISNYDIIEPGHGQYSPKSSGGTTTTTTTANSSTSPTRKKPASMIPSSPRLLNFQDIPYDASAIGSTNNKPSDVYGIGRQTRANRDQENTNKFAESFNIHDPKVRFLPKRGEKDDEILREEHHAPTPYDLFVGNAGMGNSTGEGLIEDRLRMSPSRFKDSLPPLPPH
jgi:hypothetical protein